MRIKPAASFPHPVLAESTGDYGDRVFHLALSVQEDLELGHAVLNGTMVLNDPSIQSLLEIGRATAGLMITCLDTYQDNFVSCKLGDVHVELSGGKVRGPVFVRGTVVATQDNLILDSKWIDSEFPDEAKLVGAGDFLALTEELRFEAGLEKLAPLESIFHLKLHEDVADGAFKVDLESESIEILVAPGLHAFLSLLRGQQMKDTLLSSLFLPVVMSVLEAMRGEDAYGDRRWYSVMTARCNAEGIDIKHGDLAESAQKLLDRPLGSLQRVFERFST
jgi:hypothetical protein